MSDIKALYYFIFISTCAVIINLVLLYSLEETIFWLAFVIVNKISCIEFTQSLRHFHRSCVRSHILRDDLLHENESSFQFV